MLELTDENFESEVLNEPKKTVLVDFWAPWCTPCRMQTPVLEQFAAQYGDRVKVVKLNTEDNEQTPAQYNIMSIPTLIVFQNGAPVRKAVGIQNIEALKRLTDI